jgi:hypothetical protein
MTFRFGPATVLAVLMIALFASLYYIFRTLWFRERRLDDLTLRPLPAIESLRSFLRRAAEMGEAVHLSPGTGGLHLRGSAAETLAGLDAVNAVAKEALSLGVPVWVTTNDALVSLVATQSLAHRLEESGQLSGTEAQCALLAQQDPLAYAAGVLEVLGRERFQGNVLIGAFGEEFLLMGQVGATETAYQVVGAARPAAASFAPLLTPEFLLGEEIYAAGTYLDRTPPRVVSLLAQDGIRMLVIVLIIVGVVLATFGVLPGTLGYLFRMR